MYIYVKHMVHVAGKGAICRNENFTGGAKNAFILV